MAEITQIKEKALECGFTTVADLDVDKIQLRVEARQGCEVCKSYNTNWACPPACGTIDECSERVHKYKRGLILQTTGEVDTMDYEEIMELMKDHSDHLKDFKKFVDNDLEGAMLVGTGGCNTCKTCTYPDEPCRFPNKVLHSMEALGMIVSDVCRDNDVKYYYGPGTLTYVACVLID
ncbi:MAG: DUF2284 domain-containing protein [Anaerofustis stercorihominis]|nr:DUF2284 domain-containing protein [Anaerofustis stercorihominis]